MENSTSASTCSSTDGLLSEPSSTDVFQKNFTFCCSDNLVERMEYLNQEIAVFGYPSIISAGMPDSVAMVNILHDLVITYRQALADASIACEELKSAEGGNTRLEHLLFQAKDDIASLERAMKSKCSEVSYLNEKFESFRKKLRNEQEKCRRLALDLVNRDTQYKHEKKKKTQEMEKLQAKLQQLLQDKRQEKFFGIDMLNLMDRPDGKRGKWATEKSKKSNELEMYMMIIANYEDANKKLREENTEIRTYLKQMQEELITALNEKSVTIHAGESNSENSSTNGDATAQSEEKETNQEVTKPIRDAIFEMPYEMVKDDIEKNLTLRWKALQKEIHQRKQQSSVPGEALKKMEEYLKIIEEQQTLIDYFTTSHNEVSQHFSDSYFLEEKSELERNQGVFYQQRISFEKERKVYTEALIQLGLDRQKFEEERSRWLQKHFLQLTPLRGGKGPNEALSTPDILHSKHKRRVPLCMVQHLRNTERIGSPCCARPYLGAVNSEINFATHYCHAQPQTPIQLPQATEVYHDMFDTSPSSSQHKFYKALDFDSKTNNRPKTDDDDSVFVYPQSPVMYTNQITPRKSIGRQILADKPVYWGLCSDTDNTPLAEM